MWLRSFLVESALERWSFDVVFRTTSGDLHPSKTQTRSPVRESARSVKGFGLTNMCGTLTSLKRTKSQLATQCPE